jgi:hypothetical protein
MKQHEWLWEVFSDIERYASKNDLKSIAAEIAVVFAVLEEELGSPPKLRLSASLSKKYTSVEKAV